MCTGVCSSVGVVVKGVLLETAQLRSELQCKMTVAASSIQGSVIIIAARVDCKWEMYPQSLGDGLGGGEGGSLNLTFVEIATISIVI